VSAAGFRSLMAFWTGGGSSETVVTYPLEKDAVHSWPAHRVEESEWASPGKGNRTVYTRRFLLNVNGQGGRVNTIKATVLGFSKLVGCSNGCDSVTGVVYSAAVDPVKNIMLIGTPTIKDVVSLNFYVTVEGIPK
jgi:hypothetical protein